MVYDFTLALYHSFSTRRSDPLGRRIWWCHIPSPSTPNLNLYCKSNGKLLKLHKHDLWEPAWSILHLLLCLHTWYHVPPFSFDSRHTGHCLTCKEHHAAPFPHATLPESQSSLPSCLLPGLVNSYSLFTAQFDGHFLTQVFPIYLAWYPYKGFLLYHLQLWTCKICVTIYSMSASPNKLEPWGQNNTWFCLPHYILYIQPIHSLAYCLAHRRCFSKNKLMESIQFFVSMYRIKVASKWIFQVAWNWNGGGVGKLSQGLI